MADPTLKRTSVTITYSSSDGYRESATYRSTGHSHSLPHAPMLEAIEELGRLCELFGFGEDAAIRVAEARTRVKSWREQRGQGGVR